VLHPDDAEATIQAWKECVATGKQWDTEHRFRGVDGKWHPILARGVPVRNEKGEIRVWAGINLDISKLKDVENELRIVDQRKNEFIATLAHELRNPLAPLRNGLHIMRIAQNDSVAIEQAREMMERQLQHMVRLIDDLMDLSRISRGKIDLRRNKVDVGSILRNALETSKPLIEQSEHSLTLNLPSEPLFVEADLIRMAQVFANLLNNAAKYTPPKGEIEMSVESNGREAIIQVRDNGIGIPEHMLSKVFDMFTQIDRTEDGPSPGGLGIGLSIVKRLVEMHGGQIEVRSQGYGLGSQFIVRLPLMQQVSKSKPAVITDQSINGTTAGRRILIVDDHEDSLSSLATMLSILGNNVRTARDGVTALQTAEDFRPEIVFLDIGMPRLNGYDACREIRKRNWANQTVIVALTGWGQDEDKERSTEAGFNHHLVKPIEFEALEKIFGKES
jgi:signal transduction histidine kinase